MRVKSVRAHILRVAVPEEHQLSSSQGRLSERRAVLAEVETDDGITGWGESYDAGGGPSSALRTMIDEAYAPMVVGTDPFETDVTWERCYHRFKDHGRKGIAIAALSAIDIALWDIKGQALGQPVWRLLGGRFRDRIRGYATGVYWKESADPLASMVEDARAIVDSGFRALKMGGGYGVAEDLRRARAMREALGPDVILAMDTNQAYTAADAVRLARGLEPLDLAWLEEPVPPEDTDGYLLVRRSTSVPIAGAEVEYTRYGFRDVLSKGLMDLIQPDITVTGGFTEYRRILALASAYNTPVLPHGWVSAVGLFANLHLASNIPPFPLRWREPELLLELDRTWNPLRDELTVEQPDRQGDIIAVPDRPGLGVTIRREAIEKYAMR